MKVIIFILLLLVSLTLFSNINEIDALLKKSQRTINDTTKINLYLKIGELYKKVKN